MSKNLETIAQHLTSKYSSERYSVAAILDSVRGEGVTYWNMEVSESQSGKRRADLDFFIQHNGRTNVSGVR